VNFTSHLLPSNSGTSLSLFRFFMILGVTKFDPKLFEHFNTLTHVSLTPLTRQFCQALTLGNFLLTDFDCMISEFCNIPVEVLAGMFSASSFIHIRRLILCFEDKPRDHNVILKSLDSFDQMISGITNLQHLESLRLKGGLRLSWCSRFAALRESHVLQL